MLTPHSYRQTDRHTHRERVSLKQAGSDTTAGSDSYVESLLVTPHSYRPTDRLKRTLIHYVKDNLMQIFRETPFFRPQNDT